MTMSMKQPLLSSHTICSDSVRNRKGEELGEIKDIMIDTESGQVRYYVLSFGGFMGMGDKYFAVPPQAISVDAENECLILSIEKERLESAPGFDKEDWPNMADETFRDEIYDYYGYEFREAA